MYSSNEADIDVAAYPVDGGGDKFTSFSRCRKSIKVGLLKISVESGKRFTKTEKKSHPMINIPT